MKMKTSTPFDLYSVLSYGLPSSLWAAQPARLSSSSNPRKKVKYKIREVLSGWLLLMMMAARRMTRITAAAGAGVLVMLLLILVLVLVHCCWVVHCWHSSSTVDTKHSVGVGDDACLLLIRAACLLVVTNRWSLDKVWKCGAQLCFKKTVHQHQQQIMTGGDVVLRRRRSGAQRTGKWERENTREGKRGERGSYGYHHNTHTETEEGSSSRRRKRQPNCTFHCQCFSMLSTQTAAATQKLRAEGASRWSNTMAKNMMKPMELPFLSDSSLG